MDLLDSVSTTLSSPNSTSPAAIETLRSVILTHADWHDPKKITDLPSEMILRIYGHLHTASEIIALNSTSRTNYWIWRMNATSISNSVLTRSIAEYDSALELVEVEDRIDRAHSVVLSPITIQKRVRIAQREARNAVQQRRPNDHREHISRDALYRLVLHRNNRLLSAAQDASHLLRLVENKAIHSRGTPYKGIYRIHNPSPPSSQDIITAYHELSILICLHSFEAMRDRLQDASMSKDRIRHVLYLVTYLLCDCPDPDKIRLGLSRRATYAAHAPWSWARDQWDLVFRPRCRMINAARRAFFAVADAMGHACVPDRMADNRSGCHGDCGEFEGGDLSEVE